MINELCSRIWGKQEFHREKELLIQEGIKRSIGVNSSNTCLDILPRLIQCATHFSLSQNFDHRKAAYEIAISAWKICTRSISEDDISIKQIGQAISLILTRLGNFPTEYFLKQQLHKDFLSDLAPSLWLEQEFHREENTVIVAENKYLVLTDFQRELWKALNNYQVVVVNAPTSAGKSFALQHFLSSILARDQIKMAVYLVPTRALISQVQESMGNIIRHDLKLDIQLSEVPYDPATQERVLFVLTPERLQILLDRTAQNIEFVVVDEAQNITDSSRGIILQSVIERIREVNIDAKILFGSPFTLNPEIFAYTFGIPVENVKIVNTEESPVSQNLIHIATDKYKPHYARILRITDDHYEQHELSIINIGTELVRENQTIAQVSYLLGKSALNIVYGSEPVKCEKVAGMISDIISAGQIEEEPDSDLIEFSKFIKQHIHKEFLLSEFIKNGVAYHYGNLPAFLRKGLEHLFSEGKVSFIVCTSTLLQGVNLPAQNIFLMSPSKGVYRDTKKPIPLTPTEFWNLAGRAGRLTKDFEGNVYVINIDKWTYNPLGKDRREKVIPSFYAYVCQRTSELLDFIEDENHASGANEGLENTFMKLFNDYRNGRIEHILARFKENLPEEAAAKLVAKMELVSQKISVPIEVTDRNPNISVFRQQELLDYLLIRIREMGPEYVIPPHPLFKYKKIQNDYLRLFKRLHNFFDKKPKNNRSHVYYANLALLWMRGRTYAELLSDRIAYNNQQRSKGQANANTEARELFREIESSLRFRYVKYTHCYNDLLAHALKETGNDSYVESIPPIYLFLELGASSQTMISLIGLGITRTGASILVEYAPRTDMGRDEAISWLRSTDLAAKDIPKTIIKEIEILL